MKKIKFIAVVLILLSAMFLISCNEEQAADEPSSQQVTDVNTTQNDSNTSNVKGQIVTSSTIENTEGGYYIPIPDSWFNKVSYEIDGTNTYIYHITKYKDELEINPVLLHINVEENQSDTTGKNVFLYINDKAYYEVIRFDAPYSQNSKDDAEFTALYEEVPMILQSVWLIGDPSYMDTSDSVLENPIGEVIMQREITNEEGGYIIPIPDSWMQNTSYEFIGTATYIYHITQDPGELEQNPVLLLIDVTSEQIDTTGLNIFLTIGDNQYFEVIRYDFPYMSDTSVDGSEFAEFFADIPMILQSTWVVDDSEWDGGMHNEEVSPFQPSDAYFAGSYINESSIQQTLLYIDEEAINYDSETIEATGDIIDVYEFSFGTLRFSGDVFIGADIKGGNYSGPRGIAVGDHKDDIMTLFSLDAEKACDGFDIIYRLNSGDDDNTIIPPSGALYYLEEGNTSLYYSCFDYDIDVEGMSIEELRNDYLFIPTYNLVMDFDGGGYMTGYSVYYHLGAE